MIFQTSQLQAEVAESSLVTVTCSRYRDIWLIGPVSEEIRRMKLPTHRQAPYFFFHHHNIKILGKTETVKTVLGVLYARVLKFGQWSVSRHLTKCYWVVGRHAWPMAATEEHHQSQSWDPGSYKKNWNGRKFGKAMSTIIVEEDRFFLEDQRIV